MTTSIENTTEKISTFLTIKNASAKFPFSESSLRHMIFLNKFGFNDKVVVRIGRKLLLKEDRLISFLNDFNKGDKA